MVKCGGREAVEWPLRVSNGLWVLSSVGGRGAGGGGQGLGGTGQGEWGCSHIGGGRGTGRGWEGAASVWILVLGRWGEGAPSRGALSLTRAGGTQVQPLFSCLESGIQKLFPFQSYAPKGTLRFSSLFCSKCYEN